MTQTRDIVQTVNVRGTRLPKRLQQPKLQKPRQAHRASILFGGVFMNVQERAKTQERIVELEKEMAALKLQLEGRPTHVRVPLKVFHLDRFPDLNELDDLTIQRAVNWLEAEVADNLFIAVEC